MAERIGTATIGINMDTRAAVQALNRLSLAAPAALGSIAPAAAGATAVLAEIAPASGVAATGILAAASAAGALKLGMTGVEDAVKAALDPSDPEAYAEALKQLSPNARSFVEAIRGAEPALARLRRQVQDRLFEDFDAVLERTAKTTMPALRRSLLDSAESLNLVGRGVAGAAIELAESGTLGKALTSANRGLRSLVDVPGQVVVAFGQVAAAAGPSFERLTRAVAGVAERVSAALADAFASGAMQRSIETAVDLAKQLGQGLANVGRVIGNVFRAADASGAGLIGTFSSLTGELARITASGGVQAGLRTLFQTMSVVGGTAARLLGEAIRGIAPVITALGPPVQALVRNLGSALTPVIRALSPLLTALATNVGRIVTAFAPLLTVAGQLVGGALRALTPILDGVSKQAALLAESASALLGPALRVLPSFVNPVLKLFGQLGAVWLRVQNSVLTALQPAFQQIGASLGRVARAVAPLVPMFTRFIEGGLRALAPAVKPAVAVLGRLADIVAGRLAGALDRFSGWITEHRPQIEAAFRQGERAVTMFALTVVSSMPTVFAVLRQLAATALDVFGTIVNSAAKVLGPIPGIGTHVKAAARDFNRFRDVAKDGLDKTGRKINEFAAKAAPKLRQRLMLNTGEVFQKIPPAQKKIDGVRGVARKIDVSTNAPKVAGSAQGAIKSVKDGKPKITASTNANRVARSARGALGSVRDRRPRIAVSTNAGAVAGAARGAIQSVRSRTVRVHVQFTSSGRSALGAAVSPLAKGGLVGYANGGRISGFPHGGLLRGSGTGTSDSNLILASNGEFVTRAAAVRHYGPELFEQLNSMRIPRFQHGGAAGQAGMTATPVEAHYHFHVANHGVLGSRIEVENWLAGALDDLRRTGRLP